MTNTAAHPEVCAGALLLHDPDDCLRRIGALAEFLADVDFAYALAYERAHGERVFELLDGRVVRPVGVPGLLISRARIASFVFQIVEDFVPKTSADAGGGALVALAELLTGGPGTLDNWARPLPGIGANRMRALRERVEERILLAEARTRLARIDRSAPTLAVEVIDPGETEG